MENFRCVDCGLEVKPGSTGGTGYAVRGNPDEYGVAGKVCYECCAVVERKQMEKNDEECLYLVEDSGRYVVSNWPGTMKFFVYAHKSGRHNLAGYRMDVWFKDHTGRRWWGVQYGKNTQIVHCKKLKNV